ncbi:MAG: LuxR C-terminal-related transcriptional regulator [Actinophytocola sp.]|uniref:LuxR C-terminal-related transcriptional regulator n=1 Tax=Actinophytocola sp. TaxID=1872138 RepID=UPI003C769872
MTLVCAPAGYGKTLLLADWIEATGSADKAWVSLDASDNDTGRFWTAVLAALRGCAAVPASSGLRHLAPPLGHDPAGAAEFVAEVIDGLGALPAPVYLVLDDLHEITSTAIWHDMASLVRHQPKPVHLVLSTRADPPLPIARLRLQGRLGELRAEELRFTHEDTTELLRRAGVHLDHDQTRRLLDQTEGWPAGLRLATRSLREVTDHDAFLTEFAGNDRAIADFLVSEVLLRLPPDTTEVLRMISVCDEVTPTLAAALTGRDDAGTILAGLDRDSSLVLGVGPDRQWFRTHPLLRAYLHADLTRQRPGTVTTLHDIAATWFTTQHQADKAFDHITLVHDPHDLINLLHHHAIPQLLTGHHHGVHHALTTIGPRTVNQNPWLSLIAVLADDLTGNTGTVSRLESVVLPAEPDHDLAALHLLVTTTHALIHGQRSDTTAAGWAGVLATHENTDLEAWARLGLGWTHLCAGRHTQAHHELTTATRLAREHGLDHITLHGQSALALLAATTGAFTTMTHASTEADHLATTHRWPTTPWTAANHLMIGLDHLLRLDPHATLDRMRQATHVLTHTPHPQLSYMVETLTGAACYDLGNHQDGLWLTRAARHDLTNHHLPPAILTTAALLEHRMTLHLGHDTRPITDWTRIHTGDTAELTLMHAWTAYAHNDPTTTETLLHHLHRDTHPSHNPTTPLETHLLHTALHIRNEQRTKARNTLDTALTLAAPSGLIRPFHHADPTVRQLLLEQAGSYGNTNDFATTVIHALSAINNPHNHTPTDTLTNREHTVLALLSTPQSIDEIATDLSVSVNTVKTHVRAIYTKLGVNTRRAAVLTARQHGIH